jgi:hypothetical protein
LRKTLSFFPNRRAFSKIVVLLGCVVVRLIVEIDFQWLSSQLLWQRHSLSRAFRDE